jgi:hypothetical protein
VEAESVADVSESENEKTQGQNWKLTRQSFLDSEDGRYKYLRNISDTGYVHTVQKPKTKKMTINKKKSPQFSKQEELIAKFWLLSCLKSFRSAVHLSYEIFLPGS